MVTHNLPLQPTPFVGRTDSLAEIVSLITDPACRLLTLVGLGGAGKTRLALEVAARLFPEFPDGIYFAPLQSVQSRAQIASAIVNALPIQAAQHLHEQLLNYLADKTLLLVVDNFEHVLEGADLIAEILSAAGQIKIVVTSRQALNLQEEWVRQVTGMAFPVASTTTPIEAFDAIRLFAQSARRVQSRFSLAAEADSIVRICQLVEGLPLAIEIAAGWTSTTSCKVILRQIEQQIDFLTSNTRNFPDRHRSIRAVLGQSWSLLTAAECLTLNRLSVFRGGFTLEAAAAIADASLSGFNDLVNKSLLRYHADIQRYDLHELVRQYAEEQLRAAGEHRRICQTHSAYFADFMNRAWRNLTCGSQVAALRDIEVEFENLRVAWRFLADDAQLRECRYFIESLWLYFNLRDQPEEAIMLFSDALVRLRASTPEPDIQIVVGHLLARLGWFYTHSGSPTEGKAHIEEALALLRPQDCPRELLAALHSLAHTSSYLRDSQTNKQVAKEGLHIAETYGYSWERINMLYWLANAHMDDEVEKPQRLAERCLKEAEALGDLWLSAYTAIILLGPIAIHMANYHEARRWSQFALPRFEDLDDILGIARAHENLGYVAHKLGDYDDAERHYLYAVKVRHTSGIHLHLEAVRALIGLAETWMMQNKLDSAAALLVAATSNIHLNPFQQPRADRLVRELRERLGDDLYNAIWEQGKLRTFQAVIADLISQADMDLPNAPIVSTLPEQVNARLPNPLTEREYEILALLAEGCSNQDIANRLFVSLNTVRSHLKHLYSKLDVDSRTRAVARAHELKIV